MNEGKHKGISRRAFIIVLFFMFLPSSGCDVEGKTRDENVILVDRVNDGDTITAMVNGHIERIRLTGIDAPEMGQEPWGEIARRRLKALVASSSWKLTVEYDVERRDKYGRLLAYLRTRDGRMLNAEMVRNGYAVLFTFPPNVKHVDEFTAAERKARRDKSGIWADNGLKEKPVDYRRSHPRIR